MTTYKHTACIVQVARIKALNPPFHSPHYLCIVHFRVLTLHPDLRPDISEVSCLGFIDSIKVSLSFRKRESAFKKEGGGGRPTGLRPGYNFYFLFKFHAVLIKN